MQILLTGVTTELGRALAPSLLAAGHDVHGIAERPHRDLDPGVDFTCAALTHPVVYRLAEQADVVVHLPEPGGDPARPAGLARVCDAAARGGARIVFPSLSLLAPTMWQQAENLVGTGWAPSLVVRIAAPVGRQADALVCRSVAAVLDTSGPEPLQVLHVDDLIRFLVLAVGTDHTGVVDLATADTTTAVSARRILGAVDPRLRVRALPGWPQLRPALDLTAMRTQWHFECGWGATDAVTDTARGLQGRKLDLHGAVGAPGRIPMPTVTIPRAAHDALPAAAVDGAEGEFDDRIDPRFPRFLASPLHDVSARPLTPMSLDLHLAGLRIAGRTLAQALDLRDPVAAEWENRLVAVFGHRIYLGVSALAAAEPRLPARAIPMARRLRSAPDAPRSASSWSAAIAGTMSTGRLVSCARMYGRHLSAYRQAADAERRDAATLELLRQSQLDARIRLLRSRVHEGWVLAAWSVLLAEVAPAQLDGAGQTVNVQSEIASLARVLRAHPYARTALEAGDLEATRTAAPMLAAAFDSALAHLGHRGPGAAELATPVLADRPDALYAAATAGPGARMHEDDPSPPGACRTLAYDTTMRFTHQLRLAARELGRRMVDQDRLAAADDVFYLTIEEALFLPPDSRLRIKRRIAEREHLQTLRLPAMIDSEWKPAGDPAPARVADQLRGDGLFPGIVEGTVRIVDSAADAGLGAGDVAVIATADVESVSLLGTPAAVLTDGGSTLSNVTEVASELGVPFVSGIADGASRLNAGMRVRVDGAAGLVTVLAVDCEVVGA
ncbi:PEP-utilizing enzyme [Mycobacterium sp. shizuoka-1]|uniref:PEP-utilizing enzyme n=1 Tax=Mycobacterium sp. shizuoka-1 TaxID=2039281 RepID=UPI000C061761|nr:PEP-utilizing enzyme [Mycobacterium sp. shizuoka-1]GAY16978.1 hypothetical protein MSZK_37040 [Mycobacterium sp. shizuoka-1]